MEEAEATNTVEDQRHLPHDLIAQQILTKLPVKSLLQFKSVSKQWYFTISSPQFAHTHFNFSPCSPTQFIFIQYRNNYYLFSCTSDDCYDIGDIGNKNLFKLGFDYHDEELVLIGTCNGLVCLASFSGFFFILWNPVTGKFRKYLDPDLVVDSSCNCRVSWGFGHVFLVDDYKIVRILELNDTKEIWVHVFSLKSNKWTRISDELYKDIISLRTNEHEWIGFDQGEATIRRPYSFHSRQGVLVNETLHWIVSEVNEHGRKIIAFDLALETFDSCVNLGVLSNNVYRDKFICVLGGYLTKCGMNLRDDVSMCMLKDSGKVESIRLSRDLRLRSCQGIVGFTGTGKFYILLEDSTIGIIDTSSKPMKYTPILTCKRLGKSRVASFVPSLVFPYTDV